MSETHPRIFTYGDDEIIVHLGVVVGLGFAQASYMLQGHEIYLGHAPEEVQPGHCILLSITDIQQTYVVVVAQRHGKNIYGKDYVEYHRYVKSGESAHTDEFWSAEEMREAGFSWDPNFDGSGQGMWTKSRPDVDGLFAIPANSPKGDIDPFWEPRALW